MSECITPENTRYPERAEPGNAWRHRLERALLAYPARYRYLIVRREVAKVEAAIESSTASDDTMRDALRLEGLTTDRLTAFFSLAVNQGFHRESIGGALALIRRMAVQCSTPLLQADMIALAASAVALSGQAVHVLTPDDNSAHQLHGELLTSLQRFGLNASTIVSGCPVSHRRIAYRAPVTVLSAREALQDYLDDRLQLRHQHGEITRKLGRLVDHNPLQTARMSGLPFAMIVDANQVLIDQACAPMIIAGRTNAERERAWAETAVQLACHLEEGLHFSTSGHLEVQLTEAGYLELKHRASEYPGAWRNVHRCSADIQLALKALQMVPGQHYTIENDRVELPPGASPQNGLLQLLESREGVPVTGRVIARGKLTFQRFFRRYQQLAAVCSDTRYIRGELWNIYGLASIVIDPVSAENTMDETLLNTVDKRCLDVLMQINEKLGQQYARLLTIWRRSRSRKEGEHLRRNLLHLDNQVGTITAFSGRTE